ncbi:uracil-DNA glycosylase [Aquabacterium olei]|uniref:Type-4 uracil-DNA glycosylase n=1 Tax=Aquabacterium olei TaxID=1296669 RepID=A0A2U8FML5_9BURK|nr:uracil-DNA glycosylase [Aquabacterium olei]AWI52262.1 uracil-DNA glycosylase [Aquabacterium olei]
MRWTERQRAMLREMGVPPFWPEEAEAPAEGMTESAAVPAAPAVQAAAAGAPVAPPAVPQRPVAVAPAAPARAPLGRPPAMADKPAAVEAPLGARPAGIDTMDWAALRATVAGCQACSLGASRKQAVFGVGHEQADWMIVGEAPGEQEDREGEPFVGRAGQLLDRMLHAIDLTRGEDAPVRQVFIANVLKCRPPANRNPQPQEVSQCEPYLLRQMALVQPKVVLAMGRFAVQSLLKTSEPIGKLRGRVHTVQGVPVVVTYHPAYLLRNPADKALAWADLCLAREVRAAAG